MELGAQELFLKGYEQALDAVGVEATIASRMQGDQTRDQ